MSIGSLAVVLSSISLVPQVIEIFRTGNVSGISGTFIALDLLLNLLWILHALMTLDRTLLISSVFVLSIQVVLVALFVAYSRKSPDRDQSQKKLELPFASIENFNHGERRAY